ncbi:MAG: hypothetical protein ACYTX0_51550, partial [Nostoc sp.]
ELRGLHLQTNRQLDTVVVFLEVSVLLLASSYLQVVRLAEWGCFLYYYQNWILRFFLCQVLS